MNCEKGPKSDKDAFSAWIKELSEAFKSRERPLLLTAAVSPNKKVIDLGASMVMGADKGGYVALINPDRWLIQKN